MKITRLQTTLMLFGLAAMCFAQPKLVRFSGSLQPTIGRTTGGVESVTLAVYREQSGGAPLWQEVQNADVDSEGRYSLLMGSTLNEGVPTELFASGEPRWLGVQVNRPGEVEQSRVLLVSVPYALKASDAETLGGKPASAYALASGPTVAAANTAAGANGTSGSTAPVTTNAVKPRVSAGSPGFIGVFTNSTDLGNSVIQQANGTIGVGTFPGANAATVPSLDLRTNPFSQIGMAQSTDYLTFFSSDAFGPAIYWNPGKDLRLGKGGAGLYNAFGFTEQLRIQSSTGNVGIGTQSPGSKLDVGGDVNFTGAIRYQGAPLLRVPGASGDFNLALGTGALAVNTGVKNTAVGQLSLNNNTTAGDNTAVGYGALQSTLDGNDNTATGMFALHFNTSGSNNVAVGSEALFANTTGFVNTANGSHALTSNTTGSGNTATGAGALGANTTGGDNLAEGQEAAAHNTSGSNNVGVGNQALLANTTGSQNTVVGSFAGSTSIGDNNIAIGYLSGSQAPLIANANIHIGNQGSSTDNATIRIGDPAMQTSFFAAGIRGVTTTHSDAIPVMIDSAGQLGTVSSSRRFKEDIADMGDASRGLMDLRPVIYRYKQPFADGSKPVQYGLIAEEVAEVYPDLVAHSSDGQIETVKYQVLDSMLLNEVQRQQTEIRELKERLAKLEALLTNR